MQRYFVTKMNNQYIFQKEDVFHISTVMRLKIGDEIEMVDQSMTLYVARIESLKPFSVSNLKKLVESRELNCKITLYYVMAKGDKTDLVVQKATELGVSTIVLLQSSRSVVKIKADNLESKITRFNKIAKEASEQSKRLMIPQIVIHHDFSYIAKDQSTLKLIADELEAGVTTSLYQTLNMNKKVDSIALLVGSEGGFSREEVQFAVKHDFMPVSLGKRILRSETAAIHFVGIIASYLEQL